MELREYQQELIEGFFKAVDDGFTAPCIVLPCGGGKSVIVAEIAKIYTLMDKQVLFLVHRKELCGQIFATFVRYGVRMEYCNIAMVQTVTKHLDTAVKPDLIITDENHHSLAESYKRIYDYFPDVVRVGVTATPERIDGSGLKDVNDKLIIGVTAKWLIENNYLAPYDYYAPTVDMPKFHIRNGDFIQSEVADFFDKNQKKIYGDVIKHYRRLADNKQAICYLPTVEFSKQTAKEFGSRGIPSAHIDGTTPKAERDRVIEDFRQGRIKILCNVDIVSEGFDVPDCECVILLRPTKSLILYTQQSMRCMRYKEGKRAIIIDHVNNIKRFGFPDRDREWLLDGHPHEKRDCEQPLKICKHCLAAVPINTKICPVCGAEFEFAEKEKVSVNIDLVKLNRAKDRVKYYLSPAECMNVEELSEYAKYHGYKPGWVYYQQKQRGWIASNRRQLKHDPTVKELQYPIRAISNQEGDQNGSKGRNETAKRYPCRAVKGWDSQAQ